LNIFSSIGLPCQRDIFFFLVPTTISSPHLPVFTVLQTCHVCVHCFFPVSCIFTRNRTFPLRFGFQRAQCSSPLVFPSVLHLCAVLATQVQRIPNFRGHSCEVTRRAEACATVSDHPTQQGSEYPLFPFLNSPHAGAALVILTRRAPDHTGPAHDILRHAETCATTFAQA